MEFGYWPVKGRAEYIRWLVAYLNLDVAEWNPSSREEWQEKKLSYSHKNPFINLPYFKDNEFVVSESRAVAYALIYKANDQNLLGRCESDRIQVSAILGVIDDIKNGLFKGETDFATKIEALSRFLSEKEWLMGYLTLADFELVYLQEIMEGCGIDNAFKENRNIINLCTSFRSLSGIRTYLESEQYKQRKFRMS